MQWVELYTAGSGNTSVFELWTGLRWEGRGNRRGKCVGHRVKKEQNLEDREGGLGKVEGASKGNCARFLGWKKSIVGVSWAGGQDQHIWIRDGTVQ